MEEEVKNKLSIFFHKAIEFIGKEIIIDSSNSFIIEEICDKDNSKGEYYYHIEYKYKDLGIIDINYCYISEGNAFKISNVVFYKDDSIDNITLLDSALNDLNNAVILDMVNTPIKENTSRLKLCLSKNSQGM